MVWASLPWPLGSQTWQPRKLGGGLRHCDLGRGSGKGPPGPRRVSELAAEQEERVKAKCGEEPAWDWCPAVFYVSSQTRDQTLVLKPGSRS